MRRNRSNLLFFGLFILLLFAASPADALPQLRVGSATTINKFNDLTYHHISLAYPLRPSESRATWLPGRLIAGVGRFHRSGDTGLVYMVGPGWRWFDGRGHWFIDASFSLAYLDQPWFGNGASDEVEDFGMHLEFMSRVSLGFYLTHDRTWSIEAGFMHLSNGGLDETNPGADFFGMDLQFRY